MKLLFLFLFFIFNALSPLVWAQNVSGLSSLLSEEGKMFFGDSPNSILVTDYPDNIDKIQDYINMIDVPPRQVLIEARVVEVRLQGEHALGINWGAFASTGGFDFGQGTWLSGLTGDADGEDAIEQAIPYKNTSYPPGGATSVSEDPFTITIFNKHINFVLRALSNSFDTNVLSAPRISTVNNRSAEIKIIQELRWAIPEVQVDEGVVSITWEEPEDSPREVGISLQATPMITEDGNILMDLAPEVSEHNRDIELSAVVGANTVEYTIPVVDVRNANTKVVIGDGQTLIIGGLIKEQETHGETKVPVIGDVPYLGNLFKSSISSKDKSELLIFVSPTIIKNQGRNAIKPKEAVAANVKEGRGIIKNKFSAVKKKIFKKRPQNKELVEMEKEDNFSNSSKKNQNKNSIHTEEKEPNIEEALEDYMDKYFDDYFDDYLE